MMVGKLNSKKHKWLIAIIAIAIIIFSSIYISYNYENKSAKLPEDLEYKNIHKIPKLKIGDWILRKGTDLDSKIIMQLSKSQYSHIGIISQIAPDIKIIHAITSEDENQQDKVVEINLNEFINKKVAHKFAIIRPEFLDENQNLSLINKIKNKLGEEFILAPKEKPHLYCSTLIYYPAKEISPLFTPKWQTVSFPMFTGEYLFPQEFINHPNTKVIYKSED